MRRHSRLGLRSARTVLLGWSSHAQLRLYSSGAGPPVLLLVNGATGGHQAQDHLTKEAAFMA